MAYKLVLERPSERQQQFLKATAKYVAYGGARGGGKSWAVRFKAIVLCFKWAGIRILILRRSYPELEENHIRPLRTQLKGIARYNETKKSITFPNGSVIRFGYCERDRDCENYQGQEYDVIFIDEATHFTEFMFNAFKAINRGVNEFPRRIYLTCNPGGKGHAWVKRLFIDRDFKTGEIPNDYVFIPAKVYDNKVLMEKDPDYVHNLETLSEDLRRAWLDGDWDVFTGQYFTEFRRDKHVVEPFTIPEHWRKYIAFDYGLDMLACYWAAFDEHGKGYIYRELYKSDLIVTQAAAEIKRLSGNEKIYARLAPADLWGRNAETGASQAEIFAKNGVPLSKVKQRDRIAGWMSVKEWLHDAGDGPQIQIFSNCPNLIRCLPLLQHDEHEPNDCANDPHEITHAPDALRYLLAGRPAPAKKETKSGNNERYDDESIAMFGI